MSEKEKEVQEESQEISPSNEVKIEDGPNSCKNCNLNNISVLDVDDGTTGLCQECFLSLSKGKCQGLNCEFLVTRYCHTHHDQKKKRCYFCDECDQYYHREGPYVEHKREEVKMDGKNKTENLFQEEEISEGEQDSSQLAPPKPRLKTDKYRANVQTLLSKNKKILHCIILQKQQTHDLKKQNISIFNPMDPENFLNKDEKKDEGEVKYARRAQKKIKDIGYLFEVEEEGKLFLEGQHVSDVILGFNKDSKSHDLVIRDATNIIVKDDITQEKGIKNPMQNARFFTMTESSDEEEEEGEEETEGEREMLGEDNSGF